MPTEKTKNRDTPDANAVYVAVEGFAVESAGVPGEPAVREGARLRGDHPLVKAAPHMFVVDGADDAEVRERRRALHDFLEAPPAPDPDRPRLPRRLRDEDAVVAIRNGDGYATGDRLSKTDSVVKRRKSDFVAVATPGVARQRALIARSAIRDGRGRTVHAGTWVDFEDPIRRFADPHQFDLPAITMVASLSRCNFA